MLIFLISSGWMGIVYGDNFISSCEDLSPDAFRGQKKPFVILRAIKINSSSSRSIQLRGYIRTSFNQVHGFFSFNNKINLYLTGNHRDTDKIFVTKGYKKILFYPNTGEVMYVDHGVLAKEFWDLIREEIYLSDLPYESNINYYEKQLGIFQVKYPVPLTCQWDDGVILDKYPSAKIPPPMIPPPMIPPPMIPPPHEYYDATITGTLYQPRSIKDTLNKKKSAISTIRTLPDIATVVEGKKDMRGSSPSASISINRTLRETKKGAILSSSRYKVCNNKGEKLTGYFFTPLKSKTLFSVYGLAKKPKLSQAYWYSSEFSEIPEALKYKFDLSPLQSKYVNLVIPQSHRKILQNKKVFPVRFEYLMRASRRPNKKKTELPIKEMNILVVGDAPSVAISGIDKMEKYLIKRSDGSYKWKISWHDVSPNGELLPSVNFDSFLKLVKAVKRLESKKRALLSDEENFSLFLNDFEKVIVNSTVTFDHVIWIKDSYQVPLSTPKNMSNFIKGVHAKGNIKRLKNTNPYKWLYIISGNMPGASKFLLEEPLSRARPSNPGEIIEETVSLSGSRQLLSKPKELALILDIVANRDLNRPKLDVIDKETISINAKDVFSELGILISLSELKKHKKNKIEYSVRYLTKDKINTLLNSNYSSAKENNCTHVYQNTNHLGLSWLK